LTGFASAPVYNSEFRAVDVQGDYAYIADNNGTFRIYDLTDPTIPIPRGTLPQGGMLDVKVSGNYAFLACGVSGIKVVDITNPDAPALVGGANYDTPGLAQSLSVFQDYLFVADGDAGVQILSIQPSGQLSLMDTIDTSGSAVQLAFVSGDSLYVADGNGGLVVLHSGALYPYKIFLPVVQKEP
jgi:hypothetical protein